MNKEIINNIELYNADCVELMKSLNDNSIDLTVTSPPYDNLRTYNGFNFDFENTAKELFRITKNGGVVVWIVNDQTINGSESGTSFKQALYFKEIGFNLHDTMIWNKGTFTAVGALKYSYAPVFEYMFIFTKNKLKIFNPIQDITNKSYGRYKHGTFRQKDGTTKKLSNIGKPIKQFGQRHNIWNIYAEKSNINRLHPAMFPKQLVKDHIISWSNENDVVFDCFLGSGTTAIASMELNRKFIGCEISKDYFDIAVKRIKDNNNLFT
jgi:DNA modification methylase